MNHTPSDEVITTPEARHCPRPTRVEEARCQQPEQIFRAELLRFVVDHVQAHPELELSMVTKSLKCLSSLVTMPTRDANTCFSHMDTLVNPGAETFFYSLAKSNANNDRRDTILDGYGKWLAQQGG